MLKDKDLQFCNCTVRACTALREARDGEALAACTRALQLATECSRPVPPTDLAHLHYNRAQAACRLSQHLVALEACHEALALDAQVGGRECCLQVHPSGATIAFPVSPRSIVLTAPRCGDTQYGARTPSTLTPLGVCQEASIRTAYSIRSVVKESFS